MNTFDKSKCLANIYHLAKIQNVKIGDLETVAGVSTGYFSRLKNGDNKATPSIEVLLAVADRLNVSIDALVNYSYTELCPSEEYLIKFIDRLISQTVADSLQWSIETLQSLQQVGYDPIDNVDHCLFEERSVNFINSTTGYPDTALKIVYSSRFHEHENITPASNFYRLELNVKKGDTPFKSVYITRVWVPDPQKNFDVESYELYLIDGGIVSPLCNAYLHTDSAFSKALDTLYQTAAESSKHPKISKDAKRIIDAFMQETELDYLPF